MRTVVDAHHGILRLLHEAGCVLHTQRDSRVALRLCEVGEELACEAQHNLVDLDPDDLLQVGVPARPRGGGLSGGSGGGSGGGGGGGGGSCRGLALARRRGLAATSTPRGRSSRA